MDETPTTPDSVPPQPVAQEVDVPSPSLPAAPQASPPLSPAELPTPMPSGQASPPPASRRRDDTDDSHRKRRIAGIILILVGLLFYAQYFLPALSWATFWPAILIVIGVYVLLKGRRS
jgi:hypothetical protein